jgi:hypothetical protein
MEYSDLVDLTERAQTIVINISPDPLSSVGVAAMMLTNFLASGKVCGFFNDEFVDNLIGAIRDNIDDSVKSINDGLAEEAATQTIQ